MRQTKQHHEQALLMHAQMMASTLPLAEHWLYNTIRSERVEIAIGFRGGRQPFTAEQRQFIAVGTAKYVAIPDEDMELLRNGGVLTHSHLDCSTFSLTDIELAASYSLAEIRVVTPTAHIHSMQLPNGGWTPKAKFPARARAWLKAQPEMKDIVVQTRKEGKRLFSHNYIMDPAMWERFTQEFGGTFTIYEIEEDTVCQLSLALLTLQL